MARNRKRRSDRRPRRPADDVSARPGVATARGQRTDPVDDAPDPLEHATPDVELAEAQLAVGRPELADAEPGSDGEEIFDDEFDPSPGEDPVGGAGPGSADGGGPPSRGGGGGSGSAEGGDGASTGLAPRPDATPSGHLGARLVHFLQGSWRELQRVQWPDRRQVMQATGVVIGFVIIAGVFLGLADWAAGKIVHFILE